MMKVMQNIMIVPILIMLQMQSVYASNGDLECGWNNLSHFEKAHYRFIYSDQQLTGELNFAAENSCVPRDVRARVIAEIEKLKKENSRVGKFLDFRKSLQTQVKDMRSQMETDRTERHELLSASLVVLCCSNPRPSDKTVVLPNIVWGSSVQDTLDAVLICIANNNFWNNEQKQSIDELLKNDSWIQAACDQTAVTADTVKKNLQSYSQAITKSKDLMHQCQDELAQLQKQERDYAQESRLVQRILDAERYRRGRVLWGYASLWAVLHFGLLVLPLLVLPL